METLRGPWPLSRWNSGAPQWVVCTYENRDDKPAKFSTTRTFLRRAKANDPATWATFDQALESVRIGVGRRAGFVFSPDDPYVGVDLDDCRDLETGELHPAAADIVAKARQLHRGVAVRHGRPHLRAWRTDRLAQPDRQDSWGGEFEIYDRGRYFCMTGSVFVDRPVSERADELAELEAAMFPRSAAEPITVPVETLDDDQVLARARAAKNADKFTRLWAGDTSGYGSASEADLALSVLAFWTRDTDQLDRLFRRSGLMRDKWERGDYRHSTSVGRWRR